MVPPGEPRPLYRKKKLWLSVFVLVPIILLASGYLFRRFGLQKQLSELREQGLPTNGTELNDFYAIPGGVDDTTTLWQAAVGVSEEICDRDDIQPLPFVGIAAKPIAGQDWPELSASRRFVTEFNEGLTVIRAAGAAGGAARFPVDFRLGGNAVLVSTQETRTLARLLQLDAHVAFADGDRIRAHRNLIDILKLSEAIRFEPTLISALVRTAIYSVGCAEIHQFMNVGGWDDGQLAAWQDALAEAEFKDDLRRALIGERAFALHAIDQMTMIPGMAHANKSEVLRLFENEVNTLDTSWAETIQVQRRISSSLSRDSGPFDGLTKLAARLLFPATEHASIGLARNAALQRCTIASLAVARHKLRHGGLPNTLAEISADLLPAGFVPNWIDPFSDEPLLYRHSDAGFTVYSVGEDEVDDGGQVASTENAPLDIGVRYEAVSDVIKRMSD